jgi:tagaturonate reductase
MKPLNRDTAPAPAAGPVKVLQFGEGNFLRGFVNWIIDILNEKTDFNGSVQVIQPRDRPRHIIRQLNEQEGLFHVLLHGIRGGKTIQENRLISCISQAFNPYDNYSHYLKLGENPELKFIFSNTTEAGIFFDPEDNNMDRPAISFPGKLTALLYQRCKYFNADPAKALYIIPCELIDKNGQKLRETVLQYARHWNLPESFTQWITTHTVFCNTLVDRIVPGFPKENIREIQQELGYEDKLVVKAEPFHLWVIEAPESVKAAFPSAQTDLQVKFASDLSPYRTRKVRILNGAHTALVPMAYLQGLRTVREAVEDKRAGNFIKEAIFKEIIPTLDLPADELEQFANDVLERFRNPFIHHELISIALNSISKYKVRVLPSVLEFIKRTGKLPERLLQALAALILFYKGEWKGEAIPLNDNPEILDFFEKAWQQEDPEAVVSSVLSNSDLWGRDLSKIDGLSEMVSSHVEELQLEEQPG